MENKIDKFQTDSNKLLEFVKSYIEQAEDPEGLLEDIIKHGLSTCIIPELVYYSDTDQFFNQYEAEIIELIADEADSMGVGFIEFLGNCSYFKDIYSVQELKNAFSWLAFELVANRIHDFIFNPEFEENEGETE